MSHVNHNRQQNRAIEEFLSKGTYRFSGSDVLVFVPVCNEEYTVANVVNGIRESCNFDILVINDGSTDSTPQILQQLEVEFLEYPPGIDSHVIFTGLKVAYALGYKYVVKIDGDDQHNPQDIPRLYEHAIKTGADIVIGSRHLHKFDVNIFSFEGSGMWFCSRLVSLLSGKRITDTTSGLKIWRREASEVSLAALQKGRLKEGSTYHVEELIIAARNKLKVEEISVTMRPRQYGETKSYSRKNMVLFPLNLVRSTIRALFGNGKYRQDTASYISGEAQEIRGKPDK